MAVIAVMSASVHEAEMPKYLGNVRCWMNSGRHLLAASFSGFDPNRTSAAKFCCNAERSLHSMW
jgi:hypothetical protein